MPGAYIVKLINRGGTGLRVELDYLELIDAQLPGLGACCRPDGSCMVITEDLCSGPGTWLGEGTDCDPNPCVGACCLYQACEIYAPEDCATHGGTYQGNGTLCDTNPCPTSSVEAGFQVPAQLTLSATPNPGTGHIRIAYGLPRPTAVTIQVFNAAGALVRRMEEGPRTAGHHAIDWDGRDSHGNAPPSGVYLARIVTGEGMTTGKVVLTR